MKYAFKMMAVVFYLVFNNLALSQMPVNLPIAMSVVLIGIVILVTRKQAIGVLVCLKK
jgi:hypothetical protein